MISGFPIKKQLSPIELLLAILIILGSTNASAAFKYTAIGMEAHDFSGKDIVTGNEVAIADLHKNNLVIVVFWATWSPRSIEQLKDMNELMSEYRDNAIAVVAVNVDAPQISAAARDHINEIVTTLNLHFPVIIDEDLKIFYTYGVIAVPSTAIIDTSGTIRYDPSGYGMLIRDIIADSIESYLGLVETTLQDTLPPGYQPGKKSSRYFSLALQLKQTGMYDRALDNLALARQADTLFAAPMSLMGEIKLAQGRPQEAKVDYSRAALLDSTSAVVWAGWGRALLQNEEIEDAREKLNKSLAIDSTYTPALIDVALCLAHQESLEDAIALLYRAAELNRGDPMIHYYMGRVYRQAGKKGEAAAAFMEALSLLYPDI